MILQMNDAKYTLDAYENTFTLKIKVFNKNKLFWIMTIIVNMPKVRNKTLTKLYIKYLTDAYVYW